MITSPGSSQIDNFQSFNGFLMALFSTVQLAGNELFVERSASIQFQAIAIRTVQETIDVTFLR